MRNLFLASLAALSVWLAIPEQAEAKGHGGKGRGLFRGRAVERVRVVNVLRAPAKLVRGVRGKCG